jgi:hypothetical protein
MVRVEVIDKESYALVDKVTKGIKSQLKHKQNEED